MASSQALNSSEASRPVGLLRLVRYGFFAVFAASIVNVLVLWASLGVFDFPSNFVGGPFGPLAIGPVIINSAVAAIGATLVYGVIVRYSARPNRMFVIIATGALVLSFAMFLAPDLADAPLRVFVVLAVMHVAAAVMIVNILTRATNQEGESR